MAEWLNRNAERRMLKAQAQGRLSHLTGEGKPLAGRPGAEVLDPAMSKAIQVMVQAGISPEQLSLKRDIDEARALLSGLTDEGAKKLAMTMLTKLELRLSITEDAQRRFIKG